MGFFGGFTVITIIHNHPGRWLVLMTITERNYKQNKLREQMYHHSQQADWCREEILRLTREYKEQNLNLHQEMFKAN